MTLSEDSPEEIAGWFRDQGWELRFHTESPPRGDVSHVPQVLRVLPRFPHWADLVSVETGSIATRWYAGGMDKAQALRSAKLRWRTEHGEPDPTA